MTQINLSMKEKQAQSKRLVVGKREGDGEGMEWEFRVKLLYIEWINNKVLLHSTGNYIQYPVINHREKCKKECIFEIYIYV